MKEYFTFSITAFELGLKEPHYSTELRFLCYNLLNCFQCVSYIKLEMQSILFSTAKETSTLKHYLYLVFMVLVSLLTKDNKAKTKQ